MSNRSTRRTSSIVARELGGSLMAHRRNKSQGESAYVRRLKSTRLCDLNLSDEVIAKLSVKGDSAWTLALLFTSKLRELGLTKRQVTQFDTALASAGIARMPRRVMDVVRTTKHLKAA